MNKTQSQTVAALFAAAMLVVTLAGQAQSRETISLNRGWTFSRDSLFTEAKEVDLPHGPWLQGDGHWVVPT